MRKLTTQRVYFNLATRMLWNLIGNIECCFFLLFPTLIIHSVYSPVIAADIIFVCYMNWTYFSFDEFIYFFYSLYRRLIEFVEIFLLFCLKVNFIVDFIVYSLLCFKQKLRSQIIDKKKTKMFRWVSSMKKMYDKIVKR